jgi:hypothetical protein
MYNFHKKKSGQNIHIFYNENFIKNRKDLIKEIKRKKIENISKSNSNNKLFESKKVNLPNNSNSHLYVFKNLNNNINTNNCINNKQSFLSIAIDKDLNNSVNSSIRSKNTSTSNNNNNLNINSDYYLNNDKFVKKDNFDDDNNIDDINKKINLNILNENEAKITKKNIENLLIDLNENIEKNTQKEKQLQIKIERLTKQNEEFMIQNQKMLKEITNNTDYNKRLETIIYFILEMIITKQKSKNAEMKSFCLSNKSNNNINYGSKDINQFGTNDYPTLEHQMNGCLQKNGEIFDFCKNFINLYLEESKKSKLLVNDQKPINIMGNKRKRSENINSNNSNLSDLNKEAH